MKSFSIVLVAVAIAVGCSDSENIGQTPAPEGGTGTDAGGGTDASVDTSSTPDGASDASRVDGFIDIFDAFPIPDGPLGGCVTCIRDHCGEQLNQCLNNEPCRTGLQCTFTTCLATGMPDPACVLGCFMGDTAAAFSAVGALMCINSSCGSACMAGLEGGVARDSSTSDGTSSPDGQVPADATPVDAASPESAAPEASSPDEAGGSGD